MVTNGGKQLIQQEQRGQMFNLNKKAYSGNATTELIANVVKELGTMFDVLSKSILKNKTDIIDLQKRIKEIEDTFIIKANK